MKYTKGERIRIAKKVCNLYSGGEWTLGSCCNAAGIDENTFRNWAAPSIEDITQLPLEKQQALKRRGFVHEVHDLYIEAKATGKTNFKELLYNKSRAGLLELVTGKWIDVKTTNKRKINGKMKVVSETITRKYISPIIGAIIFALKHTDKEVFGDSNTIILELPEERKRLSKMSLEELMEEQADLNKDIAEAKDLLAKRQ
jgi:hypothetical protein